MTSDILTRSLSDASSGPSAQDDGMVRRRYVNGGLEVRIHATDSRFEFAAPLLALESGVRIEVDVTFTAAVGDGDAAGPYAGVSCVGEEDRPGWVKPRYLFAFDPAGHAFIALESGPPGQGIDVLARSASASPAVHPTGTNRVTAYCLRDAQNGLVGTASVLVLNVNGTDILTLRDNRKFWFPWTAAGLEAASGAVADFSIVFAHLRETPLLLGP